MKKSKSIISLILALLIVLSACSVLICNSVLSVSAATGDTIYFEKPSDWNDTVYIYWWNANGCGEFPGNKMTKLTDTVYSYTVTTAFTNFNINDGGSNVSNPHQTVDLTFPGNNKIGKVGASAGANSYGNECWNLSWSTFEGLGLSVSASAADCDFVDSLTVTLNASSYTYAEYAINEAVPVPFDDGDKITLGADAQVGDKLTLVLSATDGTDTVSATYTYTKTDSPIGASIVYFDNSVYNWDEVYCYTYGSEENAEWPGEAMSCDSKSGLYYITFSSDYVNQNIIFNNGLEEEAGGAQYPSASGLSMKLGDCKLLTSELQWIDYGKPDSKPYGFAYTAGGTKFSTDSLNVDIDLKNAVKGTYSVDGGTAFEYTERTTVAVGQGVIGNSEVTLTLTAVAADGTTTVTDIKYYKTFTPAEVSYYSPSDGSTTRALGGYYGTNPDMNLGSYKTGITVDGNPSEWDSSMLIAQGVANDDPRVYMPSAIHERSVDDYALYAAWDDDNIYFMWEMANVSGILGGDGIFSAQKPNGSIWNPGLPVFLVLSVDPTKHADGKARELNVKTNTWVESATVWDSGITFDTNVDTFIAFDSANTNGGAAIIPLDDEGFFNYTESINIGRPTNDAGVLNRNGFEIAWGYGTLSESIIGINGFGGSRSIGDTYDANSDWVDFFDLGYDADDGFIYEIAIPLEHLGIDREYIETEGIGAMLISTFGTSGMNTLPHDVSVLDNADVEYSFEPSTSHEKEDADHITAPLARVGALLKDSVVEEIPLELNFGANKSSAQGVGTEITLLAEVYGTDENYTVTFEVDGKKLSSTGTSAVWTPAQTGSYEISATVTTASGKSVTEGYTYSIGEAVAVTAPPETEPPVIPTRPITNVTTSTDPSENGSGNTQGTDATIPSGTTPVLPSDPSESSSAPIVVIPTNGTTDTGSTAAVDSYLLGDADLNGKINIKDATTIQKHSAKLVIIEDSEALKCADAQTDGVINVKDATIIQKFVANFNVDYPVGKYIK